MRIGLEHIRAHIPRHDGTKEAAGHTDQHGAAPRWPTPADSTTSPEALGLEQRVSQLQGPSGWLQRLARSASRGRDGEGVNSVSAVVCAIRVRAVAREGILASIPARPVPRKVARWPLPRLEKFLHLFMSTRIKKTAVNQMIAAAPGTIAKLREAKKMEGSRGGAGGSARQESWQHSKTNTQHWSRFSDPRGMDPRIFLLWRKRIRLRFFALFGR